MSTPCPKPNKHGGTCPSGLVRKLWLDFVNRVTWSDLKLWAKDLRCWHPSLGGGPLRKPSVKHVGVTSIAGNIAADAQATHTNTLQRPSFAKTRPNIKQSDTKPAAIEPPGIDQVAKSAMGSAGLVGQKALHSPSAPC